MSTFGFLKQKSKGISIPIFVVEVIKQVSRGPYTEALADHTSEFRCYFNQRELLKNCEQRYNVFKVLGWKYNSAPRI